MAGLMERSFRRGQKELYLPTAQIGLLRSKRLPPNLARFRVPLYFSKLDLRDYLFHAYNTRILSVRSYVRQMPVRSGKKSDIKPVRNRWHRPKSQKYMTVELERPFVWPEEPENYEEWNEKEVKMSEVEQKVLNEQRGSLKDAWVDEERRKRMREQAKALLQGNARWQGVEKR